MSASKSVGKPHSIDRDTMGRAGVHWTVRGAILVLLASVFSAVGCKKPQAPVPPPPAPVVVVVEPVQKEIIEWDEYTGRLAAAESVEIRARVSGYLQSISFQDGQRVAKGDLLFVIDPRPFEADYARAEASLRQAEAQVTLATRNFSRSEELRTKGVISQEQFDTAVNALKEAQTTQQAAQAAVTAAKLSLDFSRIDSPIEGRVSRKNVSVGNLVTGGVANGTLLTTVVSYDPIDCFFEVDERSFLKYQKVGGKRQSAAEIVEGNEHTQVEMALADEEGFPHKGRLNFIDNRVSTETNTIELRATFSNPDLTLTPGLFARVRIPATERYRATLIPDQAVQTDQARTFVYTVGPDNKVVRQPMTLGPMSDGLRVVRSGVKPEDRVIVSGSQAVRPGQVVQPQVKPVTEIVPDAQVPEPGKKQAGAGRDAKGGRSQTGEAGRSGSKSKKEAEEEERMRRRDEHLNKGTK